MYGRWTRVLKHWWLRGLDENNWTESSSDPKMLSGDFKMWLDWNENEKTVLSSIVKVSVFFFYDVVQTI